MKVLFASAATLAIYMLSTQALAASVAPGNTMPEALNGVAPAGGMCRRDDLVPTSSKESVVGTHYSAAPDLSCSLGAAELQSMRNRNVATLVDVRHASNFEASHIEGAMNVSVAELRTKAFLRAKPLVLIGSGRAERELYSACTTLKGSGFREVKVLRGGVPAWLAYGQPLVGREEGGELVPRLSTSDLWLEGQFDSNLVLLVPAQAAIRAQLPSAMPVPDASAAVIKTAIERHRKATKNAPLAAVVLAIEPTTTADSLRLLRNAIAPVPLLIYAQPVDVFAREMRQQQVSWAAHARGPKQPPCGL